MILVPRLDSPAEGKCSMSSSLAVTVNTLNSWSFQKLKRKDSTLRHWFNSRQVWICSSPSSSRVASTSGLCSKHFFYSTMTFFFHVLADSKTIFSRFKCVWARSNNGYLNLEIANSFSTTRSQSILISNGFSVIVLPALIQQPSSAQGSILESTRVQPSTFAAKFSNGFKWMLSLRLRSILFIRKKEQN